MPRNPLRAAARRETGRPVKSFRPGEILSTGSAGKAILSDWSTERGIREGYASSQWVYAAVRRISQAAASVPWVASVSTPEGEEDRPEHPLTRLMSRPNSHISGHDMIERIVCHLYLGGNAILSKIRYRGVIDEIWPIMPDRVKPIPDARTFISGYEVTNASGRRMIEKSRDICHLMFVDPGSDYWGMAPLRAAAMSVDTDVEAVRWNRIALQNRAVTDGVLSTDQSLTDEQYERLAEQIQGHRGPDNARRAFILEGGLGWQQMSLSPAEMDFVDSRRMTREDILAVFGVPPAMVGIVQSATQSDVLAMRRSFWLDTVVPLMRDMGSGLNLSLSPEFGENVRLRPMLETVDALQEDRGTLIAQAVQLFSMGVDMREINRMLELGLSEEGLSDVGYLAQNLVPISEAGAAQSSIAEQATRARTNQSIARAMLGLGSPREAAGRAEPSSDVSPGEVPSANGSGG